MCARTRPKHPNADLVLHQSDEVYVQAWCNGMAQARMALYTGVIGIVVRVLCLWLQGQRVSR